MSECRSLTNIIGNGVATVIVSWSEGELDRDMMNAALRGETNVIQDSEEDGCITLRV